MLSRGKSPRLKGNPNFRPSLSLSSFCNDQHTASNSMCSNLTFFRTHLLYLWDCVHFLGINYAHNSNSNNRCMKRCTRTVWKTMLVLFSTFSCRAANESSSSELELAQLNSYENSSELKLSEAHDRVVEHDSCLACNDLESISS